MSILRNQMKAEAGVVRNQGPAPSSSGCKLGSNKQKNILLMLQ